MATLMQMFRHNLNFFYPPGKQCLFSKKKNWSQLCHLGFDNSVVSRNILQDRFGCNVTTAGLAVDFPLLNVIPGSASFNRTDEVSHILGRSEHITHLPYPVVHCMELTMYDVGISKFNFLEPWYSRILDNKEEDEEIILAILKEIHAEWDSWRYQYAKFKSQKD